ncbi:hypothetical protein [Leptospira sp. GIMC2001]|uniref:hypothetical protein n=1 Tax=Leptospira sp. GIMC2001 TaxID=1513297 RepID=UPI00234BB66C|nr:hypothetical protein [Leptospira sp. GIMC2001]WCL48150.1 hypothetical protein O4O04_12610 [Leptospira sp. GIMC2001]
MKNLNKKPITRRNIIAFLSKKIGLQTFIFLLIASLAFPILSQPNTGSTDSANKQKDNKTSSEQKAKDESKAKNGLISGNEPFDNFNGVFEHRLQFRLGFGLGRLDSAILNETGQNWLVNSALRQNADPNSPLAIPVKESKNLATTPQYRDITYGYKNKFEIQFAEDWTLGKFGRGNPASVEFVSPRTPNYWASAFEGNRLLRFEGKSQHFRLSYIHPVLGWLMIGPSINIHQYSEKNQISYGSYTSSRPVAGSPDSRTTWSFGGDANAEYSMRGILPGILIKMKLTDWWEIRSRFELLNRSGNFSVFGAQFITQTIGENQGYAGALPIYAGKASDKGNIFFLESSFRYCRFSLDIGMIRQDFKRTYSEYFGDTLSAVNRSDYSARSSLIGISEISTSSRQTTLEIYIMPGVSFQWDADGIY